MNNLMNFFVLAGVIFLTACGSADDKTNDNFITRVETLPSNFTNRAVAISQQPENRRGRDNLLQTLGKEYFESVYGSTRLLHSESTYIIFGKGRLLTPEDGVLMVFSELLLSADVAVGIYNTTDVGAPLTRADATATFTGTYMAKVAGTTAIPFGEPSPEIDEPITLTADFNAGTLRGTGNSRAGSLLTVSGKFSGKTLSGSVNFSPSDSGNSYDAPLTGLIGQDGTVGSFVSGRNEDYAFGGGFVAERDSQ